MLKLLMLTICIVFATPESRNERQSKRRFFVETQHLVEAWDRRAVELREQAEMLSESSPHQKALAHEAESISADLKEVRALLDEMSEEPSAGSAETKIRIRGFLAELSRPGSQIPRSRLAE